MNKERLLDLFSQITKEEQPVRRTKLHYNSRVLLVDGINTFLRSFAAINHINRAGHHVGGLTGFLKSIGSAIRLHNPTRVIIAFDGEGGSVNRKYLYPEYKANRSVTRIVNYKSFGTKEEEDESKMNEVVRLMDYLKLLPVNCICIDKLEADDVMGYLSQKIYKEYKDAEVITMSSDNDYLQLVNDRISHWSPTKKKQYFVKEIEEEFGVHPENFIIYKALIGDTSDNIPGVHGIGKNTVSKLFDILKEPSRKQLVDIYEICKEPPRKSKMYQRILEQMKMVEVFYKLVNLKEPNISTYDIEDIDRQFYRKVPALKKYDFIKLYNYDKMGDTIPHVENWLNLFSILNNF